MKKIFLAAVLLFTAISTQAQKEINWLSFEEAIQKSEANPKPILVDLYTDWCGWCKKMDKTTYKNDVIVKYINDNYYAVKMDGEGKDDINFQGKTFKYVKNERSGYHQLAAEIMRGKMSYPSTAFFNKEKQMIQTVPGYLTKERFEKILAFFNNDTYKSASWTDFEKNFKSAI